MKRKSIAERIWLKPGQIRAVARWRYADAVCLCDSGRNDRANGAMYLGGFAVECLLKAQLMQDHPWLQSARSPERLKDANRLRLWSLCFRMHDLHETWDRLPGLQQRVMKAGGRSLVASMNQICARWTVYIRYSPYRTNIADARQFLARIKELMPWLQD